MNDSNSQFLLTEGTTYWLPCSKANYIGKIYGRLKGDYQVYIPVSTVTKSIKTKMYQYIYLPWLLRYYDKLIGCNFLGCISSKMEPISHIAHRSSCSNQ